MVVRVLLCTPHSVRSFCGRWFCGKKRFLGGIGPEPLFRRHHRFLCRVSTPSPIQGLLFLEKLRYRGLHDWYWARRHISRPWFELLRLCSFPLLLIIFYLSSVFHLYKMKVLSFFGFLISCILISLVVFAFAVPQGIQQNTDPQISTSRYKFKSFYLVNLQHHQLLTRWLSRRDLQTMAKVRWFYGEYQIFRYSPTPLPDIPIPGNQLLIS